MGQRTCSAAVTSHQVAVSTVLANNMWNDPRLGYPQHGAFHHETGRDGFGIYVHLLHVMDRVHYLTLPSALTRLFRLMFDFF